MIEEMATYIDTNSTLASGTTLWINAWGNSTKVSCALFETPGAPSQYRFGGKAWDNPSFQVVVRSTRPVGGEGVANSQAVRTMVGTIYTLFNDVSNTTSLGARYLHATPLQPPFRLDTDPEGRTRFAFNCQVARSTS